MRRLLEKDKASKPLLIWRVSRQLSIYLYVLCMLACYLACEYLKPATSHILLFMQSERKYEVQE